MPRRLWQRFPGNAAQDFRHLVAAGPAGRQAVRSHRGVRAGVGSGISPFDAPPFIAAQLIGAVLAWGDRKAAFSGERRRLSPELVNLTNWRNTVKFPHEQAGQSLRGKDAAVAPR